MSRTFMDLADRVIRRFLLAHVAPASRVIDVGSGTGWESRLLAREVAGCSVDAVDVDDGAVHQAATSLRHGRNGDAVRCVRGQAEDLVRQFGRARYDVAVSVHALHHYADPFRALQQIRAVLKRRGLLLIAEFGPRLGERLDDCPRYSLAKVSHLVQEAGFWVSSAEEKRPGVLLVAGGK